MTVLQIGTKALKLCVWEQRLLMLVAYRTNPEWVYGFAELHSGQRDAIAAARLITNPGCYPTGFLALARPLIASGVLSDQALLSIPAVSGYSGGGRSMIERHDAGNLDPASSYGTNLQHKHLDEMTGEVVSDSIETVGDKVNEVFGKVNEVFGDKQQ